MTRKIDYQPGTKHSFFALFLTTFKQEPGYAGGSDNSRLTIRTLRRTPKGMWRKQLPHPGRGETTRKTLILLWGSRVRRCRRPGPSNFAPLQRQAVAS